MERLPGEEIVRLRLRLEWGTCTGIVIVDSIGNMGRILGRAGNGVSGVGGNESMRAGVVGNDAIS